MSPFLATDPLKKGTKQTFEKRVEGTMGRDPLKKGHRSIHLWETAEGSMGTDPLKKGTKQTFEKGLKALGVLKG